MSDPFHFSALEIARLHDRATALWHRNEDPHHIHAHDFLDTVLNQHRANFDLWHTEDRARDPRASDHDIAEVKRSIDRYNQRRNDLAEQCDATLLNHVTEILAPHGGLAPTAPLHSESPGLIIDRLSILALKIAHTQEEIDRPRAPAGHTDRNRARLAILIEQRDDLVGSLDQLWADVLQGRRRFKIYRQLKMYNDPSLNPSIYGRDLSS
ncbi:MAG TPA: DUF4254 domain-containing protein [Acidobacteriaceae bacterium]|jgi:hypothetical protein|nr:DUF4254 domain-containing protein [Acidobacteriaceae bacterium]